MPEKSIITTDKAPKAIGPYSAGVKVGHFVYTAGQAGLNPQTGKIVDGGIEPETRQTMSNLKHILEAADSSLDQVVKTTVFLQDMNDFGKFNEVYSGFFKENPPARSCVQAARLPLEALVEIEAIAVI